MGRRWATWLIAAAVFVSGCIPRTHPTAPSSDAIAEIDEAGTDDTVQAAAPPRQLTPEELKVQALEAQLAERDREIAAVQAQLQSARQGGGVPAPVPAAVQAPASAAPAPAAAGGAMAAKDAELADARHQIATLESRLESEVQRRKQVESEMARVLEETSAGPFEKSKAGNVVDQHLRDQLASAQQEITELRATLATERRDRNDLTRRYAALQEQLDRAGHTATDDSEEVAALKERQRRVLASIQQDLAASQQRETELRTALEQQDGAGGVSLADSVTSLRSENTALQRRLDDEHRQNRELASKLKLAGRVTDLIFKMQSNGTAGAATVSQ
jgi:DNA repair exonuclease SbcCD ATPase subunit